MLRGSGDGAPAQSALDDADRLDNILHELSLIKSAVVVGPDAAPDGRSTGNWVSAEFERLQVRRLALRLHAELRQRRESLIDNLKMLEDARDDTGAREVRQQLVDLDTQERYVREASTFAQLEDAAKGPFRDLYDLLSR